MHAHNFREPGQPRYMCVRGCPRRGALAELEAAYTDYANDEEPAR
jgi:hypothetical protein